MIPPCNPAALCEERSQTLGKLHRFPASGASIQYWVCLHVSFVRQAFLQLEDPNKMLPTLQVGGLDFGMERDCPYPI